MRLAAGVGEASVLKCFQLKNTKIPKSHKRVLFKDHYFMTPSVTDCFQICIIA